MSRRELERVEALARVRSKQLLLVDAGRLMRVTYRQAKGLWKRYRKEGAAGLQHRSAGQPSHRAHEEKFRREVLRLVREKYGGEVGERFGPTLAAEHLASEDGLKVDAETLRRWMLAAGLWSRERKRRRHRRWRERKEHFGELVQMDANKIVAAYRMVLMADAEGQEALSMLKRFLKGPQTQPRLYSVRNEELRFAKHVCCIDSCIPY